MVPTGSLVMMALNAILAAFDTGVLVKEFLCYDGDESSPEGQFSGAGKVLPLQPAGQFSCAIDYYADGCGGQGKVIGISLF